MIFLRIFVAKCRFLLIFSNSHSTLTDVYISIDFHCFGLQSSFRFEFIISFHTLHSDFHHADRSIVLRAAIMVAKWVELIDYRRVVVCRILPLQYLPYDWVRFCICHWRILNVWIFQSSTENYEMYKIDVPVYAFIRFFWGFLQQSASFCWVLIISLQEV